MSEQNAEVKAPEVVTKEQALGLAHEAARVAVENFQKANPGLTPEQVKAEIQEDRKNLANMILGNTGKSDRSPVKDLLESDPESAFAIFGNALRDQLKSELMTEISAGKAYERELADVSSKFSKERPDIVGDEKNATLWAGFYRGVDSDLPEKDKILDATKKFDLFLEEHGLGSKETRLEKFSSVRSGSNGASASKPEMKSEDAIWGDVRDERLARHEKIRNHS